MKITFTVHLFRFCSVLEWKLIASVKGADCQNLSLKTSNSQQNVESGLFLHQVRYVGQCLVLDLDFPFPQSLQRAPLLIMACYQCYTW